MHGIRKLCCYFSPFVLCNFDFNHEINFAKEKKTNMLIESMKTEPPELGSGEEIA